MDLRKLITGETWVEWAAGLALAIAIICGVGWLITAPSRHAAEVAKAHAAQVIGSAETQSAQDATAIVAQTGTEAATIDATTRKNDASITAAPGAQDAVAPAVADAGRRALCLRHAYAHDPGCIALLKSGPR